MTDTPSNPCRLCGSEIIKGRGNYRTSDGLVCFSCLRTMTPAQKKAEEVAANRWTLEKSERAQKELEEQEYLAAQANIAKLLFPLEGPRRAASREILTKIKIALAVPDSLDRAMKVNSLVRAASPGIEAAIRELQKKRQGKVQASVERDPSTTTPQAPSQAAVEGGK